MNIEQHMVVHFPYKSNHGGFTLIELLIALFIFAILSTLTTLLLQNTLRTEKHLKTHSEQTQQLQRTVILLTQSIRNLIPRGIRGNELHLFPPLIGQAQFLEFSQLLNQNPGGTLVEANIIRVAYLCQNHQLIRRRYLMLDTLDRHEYRDTLLLDKLKNCQFSYIDTKNNSLNTWIIDDPPPKINLPAAIEWTVQLENNHSLTLLFPIAVGQHYENHAK